MSKLSRIIAAILSVGTHVAVAATTAEQCLTGDQTWTPPPGLTTIKRLVVVGGGAAGGADGAGNFGPGGQNAPNGGATAGSGWGAGGGGGIGGGGGQAGLINDVANVAVTGPVAVTVGKGGTTAGTKGGQSCFGTTCANGGGGGGSYNDFSPVSGGQAGWGGADGAGTQTAPTQELGSVQVGGTSAAKTITVVNNSPVTTTFYISPPLGLTLTSDNCSGQSIGALSSCTFNLAAAPTSQGDFSKKLEVNTGRGKLIIPVHATATPPALEVVAPTTLPVLFGSQDVTPATVTVKNSGSMALTLGALTMGGTNASAFSVSAGTCTSGASIAANGGTCSFIINFTPPAEGHFSGTAQLAVVGGTTLTVGTSGIAALNNLIASETTVDFGTVPQYVKATKTVTVRSPNKWAVAITPAIASGGTYYTVESTSCSGVIPPGGTCTLTVGFNPRATTTAQPGSLDITF